MFQSQGALVSVTVTTMRKVISTVISFLTFAKPFSVEYFFAGLVLLTGVTLNIASKNKKRCESLAWACFSRHFFGCLKFCVKFKTEDASPSRMDAAFNV